MQISQQAFVVIADSPENIRDAITYSEWQSTETNTPTLPSCRTGDILLFYSLKPIEGLVAFATFTNEKQGNNTPRRIEFQRNFSLPFLVWGSQRIQLASPPLVVGISILNDVKEINRILALMNLRWGIALKSSSQVYRVQRPLFSSNKCDQCGKDIDSRYAKYCVECRTVIRRRQVRDWNRNNKEKIRAAQRRWREDHREELREYRRRRAYQRAKKSKGSRNEHKENDKTKIVWSRGLELSFKNPMEMSEWCRQLRKNHDHLEWIVHHRGRIRKLAEIEAKFRCCWEDKLKELLRDSGYSEVATSLGVGFHTVSRWSTHLGLKPRRKRRRKQTVKSPSRASKPRVDAFQPAQQRSGGRDLLRLIDSSIVVEVLSPSSESITQVLKDALRYLPKREAFVIEKRYLNEAPESRRTLEQLGSTMCLTRERIRQIESKALERLRHPSIVREIRQKLAGLIFPEQQAFFATSSKKISDLEREVIDLRMKLNETNANDLINLRPEIQQMPLSELRLSVRAQNCMNRMRIKTLGELASKTKSEMLAVRNLGRTTLIELTNVLHSHGLQFLRKNAQSS